MTRATSATTPASWSKFVVTAAAVVLAAYLVWALRSLIVPACVGGLLAYICRPLVARLERYRIPRGLAVALLLLMFALVALGSVNSVRAVMPSETGVLELRVRALYALNRPLPDADGTGSVVDARQSPLPVGAPRAGPVDGSCE